MIALVEIQFSILLLKWNSEESVCVFFFFYLNSVFIPVLLHFTSRFCSFLSLVFSGSSKLERGPGFSAPSESSVSDDTASFHTGPGEREWREGG